MTNNTVTTRDFATGLLAGLVRENFRLIPTREAGKKFEWAVIDAYRFLASNGAELDFERENSVDGLIVALQNGLGNLGADGILRIEIDRDYTDLYFENLPLSEKLWRNAAKTFLDCLELKAE